MLLEGQTYEITEIIVSSIALECVKEWGVFSVDIFQYLEEMQEDVFSLAVEQIEAKYYDICCMLASTEYAERIKVIDVESYKVSIRVGLMQL